MSKLAAKILGMFVSEVPAGACVTDHLCCCGKKGHGVGCKGACVKMASCRTGGTCNTF